MPDTVDVLIVGSEDIFELRTIDRRQGALVVVRPDQYVSNVLPMDGYDALTAFSANFY